MNDDDTLKTLFKLVDTQNAFLAGTLTQVMEKASTEGVPKAIKDGDWKALASYLRLGGNITDELRGYLADILDGKVKRLDNRPPSRLTTARTKMIGHCVMAWRSAGIKPKVAESMAIERFGADRTTIQRAVKSVRDKEDWGRQDFSADDWMGIAGMLEKTIRAGAGFLEKMAPGNPSRTK
jgi:hypothetical protein